MIDRAARNTLERLAAQFPVIGVTGPRQSGKTTLCRAVFPEKRYITLDDRQMRALAESNPKDFLRAFPDGVIIDEAQKAPDLFDAIKEIVDTSPYEPGKYILTGASQFRQREKMTDSLAGRASFLELLPFSVQELKEADLLSEDPYDLIFNGQYPPLYDPERNYITKDWFKSYIDTYIDLDVKNRINEENVTTFKKFISLCAFNSGKLLSLNSMAKDLGVSQPTVKNWLHILERSYIVHLLEPDTKNLGKALIKTPKLYFVDSGLLCYLLRLSSKSDLLLSEHKGHVVETFAVAELLKQKLNRGEEPNLTFYRDKSNLEVDAVVDWAETFAVEVKSSSLPEPKLAGTTRKYAGLRNAAEGTGTTKSAVFYLGDITMTIGNTRYVSWKDWGSFLK